MYMREKYFQLTFFLVHAFAAVTAIAVVFHALAAHYHWKRYWNERKIDRRAEEFTS